MNKQLITEKLKDYTDIGEICSNFDHEIDLKVEKKLQEGKFIAEYPAWNFHGTVWFDEKKYHCAIMQYHSLSEVMEAETFKELKDNICEKYGEQ